MQLTHILTLASAAILASARPSPPPPTNPLKITTSTGTYIGLINGTTPNVRQFLNIPYALPPTRERRWLAPELPTTNASVVLDATKFSPVCPQHLSDSPNVFNTLLPGFLVPRGPGSTSEDCLSLAIWTPTGDVKDLPVMVFMTGGGFIIGGASIANQLPHRWVQRTQAHIVVSINYRVDIMGFPHARGLQDNNLGILDQRRAHEWVRGNIRAFGGDPEKITLWGQSAGGASTEFHAFAYYKDPIAKGLVLDSGTAIMGIPPPDPAGLVSHAPAIIGSNTDEGASLVPYTGVNIGPDRAAVDAVTQGMFLCPAARTAATRVRNKLTTYRYLNAGNFTNTSPVPWLGAYHSGDLPYWFGTYGDFARGPSEQLEVTMSEAMQDYLLAFMRDPSNGLRKMGWPEARSGRLVKFPGEEVIGVKSVDGVCG